MKKNNKNLIQAAIVSAIAVAVILVIGTIWMGQSASKGTESAVRSVSLLYLSELTDRREQVVASTLEDYISDMDVALGILDSDDLASEESLKAYQIHMLELYGFQRFAFVDESGLIYTSRGTRTDIDKYDFDYQNLSEPKITIKDVDDDAKKLVIAMPTDRLPFGGSHLICAFMEMDIDTFLETISLQTNDENTTYCNLYTSDGESLTDAMLGGLSSSETNILDAFDKCAFEEGYTAESVKKAFSSKQSGVVSFTYNGTTATMFFAPVHRTNWMLTYMIKESTISALIDEISRGIVRRSFIMSAIIAIILIFLFGFMIFQTRRAASLAIEQETNEMLQQELEERIALQDELLEQEKKRVQQDSMITALASDYRSVYYYDLVTGKATCYRSDKNDESINEGDKFNFQRSFKEYADDYVDDAYREGFLEFIKPENIKAALEKEDIIAYRYLVHKKGVDTYEMLRMASVSDSEDEEDTEIHALGVGFTDIDADMRDSLAKNQALSDALKAAEEASKAKTTFLSSMSHEIRTPMNAIIGLDSLALHEPDLPDVTRDYLEKIGSSAQHLLSLINDILDMSRIESGRMVLKNEEFALSKLMEQINVIFSGQCQEKGLTYECRVNGQLDDYYIGDNMKLRQVLINILGNAVKFTPEGGKVELIAEKTAEFEGKSTIRFTIKDTGIGMSKDYLPKIFDTFSQENAGAANKYGSSGLGMAITKSIVEMMNGNIEVESEKGKGSKFTVTVTLLDSDRKAANDDEDIDITPGEMSVLVIDDDPIACDQAKLVLGQAGINADVVQSGQEAVEAVKLRHARRDPYNLIIVDWQMPEMDGVETTKKIRDIIGNETAIIILTAYSWDDIFEEAKAAGVDSFIAKPLFSGNLLDELKAALRKKKIAGKETEHKADLKGRNILLAEDMEINAQIMMKVLKMKEITAEHALNGKIAVDMFAAHPENYYDAILMDMRMPEMDGLEATKTIRAMDRSDAARIPIIALTANAFDEDVQKSLQAGLNAHLSKPIQPDVLFETLETLIKD